MAAPASSSDMWWSKETVAVVTGGNKGIGYEIVKGLAQQGVTTVLTARDEQRGLEAVNSLDKDWGLKVYFHKLDVRSATSVNQFADWVKASFGALHILVNNAGVSGYGFDAARKVDNAKSVFETNYSGVRRVTEALVPLMSTSSGARIINISSGTSRLDVSCFRLIPVSNPNLWQHFKNEELRNQISNVEQLSAEAIESFIQTYLDDVAAERVVERGWPQFFNNPDYCVSKIVLNAYTRMLARNLQRERAGEAFFVNCICPGLTSTDMTFKSGHPPQIGADTAVWLALLPPSQCATGKFFIKRMEVDFHSIPFYCSDIFAYSLEDFEALTKQQQ